MGRGSVGASPGDSSPVSDRRLAAVSIEAFLDELASGAPTPGGGSAAALAGALGAALVAMVCRVSAARDPGAAELAGTAARADGLRYRLADLATADALAYEAVLAARRLPAQTRETAVQAALRRATEVPLDLVAVSSEVLGLCDEVAGAARASTLGDLGVAVALAGGSLEGGAVTVRVNLKESADAEFAKAAAERVADLIADGRARSERVARVTAERLGGLN